VSAVQPARRALAFWAAALAWGPLLVGCATSVGLPAQTGGVVAVVAAENSWGDIAQQLGGAHARVISIVNNPNADPHDYEPTAGDARRLAFAQIAVVNGIGYDGWASKLLAANPVRGRVVLTVGDVVGIEPGGNPHRWYSPPDVRHMIDALTTAYQRVDPRDAAYFARQRHLVLTRDLKTYFADVAAIKARYAGTPIGASESIVTPLADALGLELLTPQSFLDAISEGSDPTAADKARIDRQIEQHEIKVYVFNSQNATPDVQAQVDAARQHGIAVTAVTETLAPAGASFQAWQVRQLDALRNALASATGR